MEEQQQQKPISGVLQEHCLQPQHKDDSRDPSDNLVMTTQTQEPDLVETPSQERSKFKIRTVTHQKSVNEFQIEDAKFSDNYDFTQHINDQTPESQITVVQNEPQTFIHSKRSRFTVVAGSINNEEIKHSGFTQSLNSSQNKIKAGDLNEEENNRIQASLNHSFNLARGGSIQSSAEKSSSKFNRLQRSPKDLAALVYTQFSVGSSGNLNGITNQAATPIRKSSEQMENAGIELTPHHDSPQPFQLANTQTQEFMPNSQSHVPVQERASLNPSIPGDSSNSNASPPHLNLMMRTISRDYVIPQTQISNNESEQIAALIRANQTIIEVEAELPPIHGGGIINANGVPGNARTSFEIANSTIGTSQEVIDNIAVKGRFRVQERNINQPGSTVNNLSGDILCSSSDQNAVNDKSSRSGIKTQQSVVHIPNQISESPQQLVSQVEKVVYDIEDEKNADDDKISITNARKQLMTQDKRRTSEIMTNVQNRLGNVSPSKNARTGNFNTEQMLNSAQKSKSGYFTIKPLNQQPHNIPNAQFMDIEEKKGSDTQHESNTIQIEQSSKNMIKKKNLVLKHVENVQKIEQQPQQVIPNSALLQIPTKQKDTLKITEDQENEADESSAAFDDVKKLRKLNSDLNNSDEDNHSEKSRSFSESQQPIPTLNDVTSDLRKDDSYFYKTDLVPGLSKPNLLDVNVIDPQLQLDRSIDKKQTKDRKATNDIQHKNSSEARTDKSIADNESPYHSNSITSLQNNINRNKKRIKDITAQHQREKQKNFIESVMRRSNDHRLEESVQFIKNQRAEGGFNTSIDNPSSQQQQQFVRQSDWIRSDQSNYQDDNSRKHGPPKYIKSPPLMSVQENSLELVQKNSEVQDQLDDMKSPEKDLKDYGVYQQDKSLSVNNLSPYKNEDQQIVEMAQSFGVQNQIIKTRLDSEVNDFNTGNMGGQNSAHDDTSSEHHSANMQQILLINKGSTPKSVNSLQNRKIDSVKDKKQDQKKVNNGERRMRTMTQFKNNILVEPLSKSKQQQELQDDPNQKYIVIIDKQGTLKMFKKSNLDIVVSKNSDSYTVRLPWGKQITARDIETDKNCEKMLKSYDIPIKTRVLLSSDSVINEEYGSENMNTITNSYNEETKRSSKKSKQVNESQRGESQTSLRRNSKAKIDECEQKGRFFIKKSAEDDFIENSNRKKKKKSRTNFNNDSNGGIGSMTRRQLSSFMQSNLDNMSPARNFIQTMNMLRDQQQNMYMPQQLMGAPQNPQMMMYAAQYLSPNTQNQQSILPFQAMYPSQSGQSPLSHRLSAFDTQPYINPAFRSRGDSKSNISEDFENEESDSKQKSRVSSRKGGDNRKNSNDEELKVHGSTTDLLKASSSLKVPKEGAHNKHTQKQGSSQFSRMGSTHTSPQLNPKNHMQSQSTLHSGQDHIFNTPNFQSQISFNPQIQSSYQSSPYLNNFQNMDQNGIFNQQQQQYLYQHQNMLMPFQNPYLNPYSYQDHNQTIREICRHQQEMFTSMLNCHQQIITQLLMQQNYHNNMRIQKQQQQIRRNQSTSDEEAQQSSENDQQSSLSNEQEEDSGGDEMNNQTFNNESHNQRHRNYDIHETNYVADHSQNQEMVEQSQLTMREQSSSYHQIHRGQQRVNEQKRQIKINRQTDEENKLLRQQFRDLQKKLNDIEKKRNIIKK